MLEQIGLTDEVRELILVYGWDQFFGIYDLTYWELTVEVMSSFELEHTIISFGYR